MNYPANHPIWKLLRLLIVGGLLLGFLAFNYNQLDSRDTMTVFGTLAGLLGYDVLKARVTNEGNEEEKKREE